MLKQHGKTSKKKNTELNEIGRFGNKREKQKCHITRSGFSWSIFFKRNKKKAALKYQTFVFIVQFNVFFFLRYYTYFNIFLNRCLLHNEMTKKMHSQSQKSSLNFFFVVSTLYIHSQDFFLLLLHLLTLKQELIRCFL